MNDKDLVILRISILNMLKNLAINKKVIQQDYYKDVIMANLLGLIEFSHEGYKIIEILLSDEVIENLSNVFEKDTGVSFHYMLMEYQRSIIENLGGKKFSFKIETYI